MLSLVRSKTLLLFAVQSSLCSVKKPWIKNYGFGELLSIFDFNTVSISRQTATYFTSDSNLFVIAFILIWPMITPNGFWFLGCYSPMIL